MKQPASRGVAAFIIVAATMGVGVRDARANSVPLAYVVTLEGTTATICAFAFNGPPPERRWTDLIRRDPIGGASVLINTFAANGCFVDECVPPGSYQYGLLDPFPCSVPPGSPSFWYGTATATADVSSCRRSAAAPIVFNGVVPWASSSGPRNDCPTGADTASSGGCASGGGGAVLGLNALALGIGLLLRRRRPRGSAGPRP